MRSLFIEYPRVDKAVEVMADLFTMQQVDLKINLPVLMADANGIEVMLPNSLTGVFYLKIQDGNQSFLERIAIQ